MHTSLLVVAVLLAGQVGGSGGDRYSTPAADAGSTSRAELEAAAPELPALDGSSPLGTQLLPNDFTRQPFDAPVGSVENPPPAGAVRALVNLQHGCWFVGCGVCHGNAWKMECLERESFALSAISAD